MRFLTMALGAFLISGMTPALSQGALQQDDMQQDEPQQAELQQGEPQQEEMRQAEPPRGELPRDAKWTVFVEPEFGTRMDVPSGVFAEPDGPSFRGVGQQFKTPDGRAVLAIYSQSNENRDSPASYLRKNFKGQRTTLAYERVTREFFVVAGTMEGSIYYSRCNFSRKAGGTLHCFDVKYPQREKRAWDGIVTRMSLSLKTQ